MAAEKDKKDIGFKPIYTLANDSSTEDVKQAYRQWVDSYEKDLKPSCYLGIYFTVGEFCHALFENGIHQDGKIIDVGAGTGLAGQHLSILGYQNVDAVDISQEMLASAKEKGVYKNLICAGLGLESPVVNAMQYDAAISSACFTLGHMKAPAVKELATIVRKGGIVAFNAREDTIEDASHGYIQCIEQLVAEGVWEILLKKKIDYFMYPYSDPRARYCYLFVCRRL